MKLVIIRFREDENQTIGKFTLLDDWNCEVMSGYTLELPDENNQRNISRIPDGYYWSVKRTSEKYGDHFHLLNVPNRSYILIHHGNYNRDTEGCILVGESLYDIDGDGNKDVTNSKKTMSKLNSLLPHEFEVEIINHFD